MSPPIPRIGRAVTGSLLSRTATGIAVNSACLALLPIYFVLNWIFCLPFEYDAGGIFEHCSKSNKVTNHKLVGSKPSACLL